MHALSLLQPGSVFVIHAVLAWLCGSQLARRWMPGGQRWERALSLGDRYALGVAIPGAILAMWTAFAAMAGASLQDVAPMLTDIVTQSTLGQLFLLSMSSLLLAALANVARAPAMLVWLLLVVFALSRAQLSHAGGAGPLNLGMLADALHLLLIAVWVGSVCIAGWLVLDRAESDPPWQFMEMLSRTAAWALAGIAVTGIYAAAHRLDSPARLIDSVYGAVLSVKLMCVTVAVALGAWNRFSGFPAADRDGWARPRLVLRIESVFLLAALAAAARLTMQQPPQ